MSEGETPIEHQIKTSVDYAFDPEGGVRNISGLRKVEEGTRGIKEKLLGLVQGVAEKMRTEGVLGRFFGEQLFQAETGIANRIWETAQDRIQKKLSGEAAAGNTQWVMATLNELDPMDVEVKVKNAKPGEPTTRKYRRSAGLPTNAEVNFHRVRPESALPDNQQDVRQIVLGGQSFRKEAVRRALAGEASLQPMWRKDGVDLFLRSSGTGETHDVSLSTEQARMLQVRLGVQEKGFVNEKQLKTLVNNLTGEPLSANEKTRSRDNRSGRRYIHTPAGFFQGRTYGKENSAADEDLHRVYFQVEPEDIPRMVEILKETGQDRAQRGEGLDFKFLIAPESKTGFFSKDQFGVYTDLEDGEPRICVYFDSSEQQKGFVRELLNNQQYREDLRAMSEKRKNPDGSYKARRPGSSVWFDNQTGEELRAINYTEGGTSEDVLEKYGEDWRSHARGAPTKAIS